MSINSPVGVQTQRQHFLKTHMTEVGNLLEILLRLVCGERATPFSQSTPTISAPSISGPLTALTQSTAHGAQQAYVSLTVLTIFYMMPDYAQKANSQKGKSEAEKRVSEIICCLPSHFIALQFQYSVFSTSHSPISSNFSWVSTLQSTTSFCRFVATHTVITVFRCCAAHGSPFTGQYCNLRAPASCNILSAIATQSVHYCNMPSTIATGPLHCCNPFTPAHPPLQHFSHASTCILQHPIHHCNIFLTSDPSAIATRHIQQLHPYALVATRLTHCHTPNRFGTVNMEDNINIKRSWCEGWARQSLIIAIYRTRRLSWCKRWLPMLTVITHTRTAKKQKKLKE